MIPINPRRIDQSIDCAAMTLQQYHDGHHKHMINPSRPFPFKGARNETGHFGYVHDPCILIRRPLPLQQVQEICHALPGNGTEGRAGQLIVDHIIVFDDHPSPKRRPNNNTHPEIPGVAKLRIFCSLYTYTGGNNLTDAIRETWGKDCDGFLAASSETLAIFFNRRLCKMPQKIINLFMPVDGFIHFGLVIDRMVSTTMAGGGVMS